MKLVVPRFGEVGIGSVADVHPFGQWLDVTIPAFSAKFILVRPLTIVANAENLFLEPCQRGCSILKDALNRTVLWRANDALALSEDPPMDNVDYVHPESWIGLKVHWLDPSRCAFSLEQSVLLIFLAKQIDQEIHWSDDS